MLVRMKMVVGYLKADAQWEYFVSLTYDWRMCWTRFRRGVPLTGRVGSVPGMAWLHPVFIEKS